MTRIKSIERQHVPMLMILVASVFFLFNTNTASAECTVSISGGTSIMNVGQKAALTATVTGGGTPLSYQWSISGDILKDYQESTQFLWSTTPMAPADFQGPGIAFYWKPDASQRHPLNGGPVDRTVSVAVQAGADLCSAETFVGVERNTTDITRQAEDIYLANHPELDRNVIRGRALKEHKLWHSSINFGTAGYGTLFFDFHRAYIGRFNTWRREFGYPTTVTWDPGTVIPTDVAINHLNRKATYALTPKPTWFTVQGGTRLRPSNKKACDTSGGQNDLFDFTNRAHLGCAVSAPYHGNVHSRVGGDMLNVSLSPVDPIFWRWHSFLDGVSQEYLAGPPAPAGLSSSSSVGRRATALDTRAPEVIYQVPFRLFRYITALPSVTVIFSEAVVGVIPQDLRVNGSPATRVRGKGAGPYVFTGYATPVKKVRVRLMNDGIWDLAGNAFVGSTWRYQLVKSEVDTDGDGVSDDVEANVLRTNPFNADTDGDGLPDRLDSDPLMNRNQSHTHSMDMGQ